MKNVLTISLLLLYVHVIAQKTYRHTPVMQKGFYLSLNPLSPLEPEQGAVGMGIGYRIDKRFELWAEANYLYTGIYGDEKYQNLHGFRGIVSGKYFYKNKYGFFVGVEFRIKQYSFNEEGVFVNFQANDTLRNYPYKPQHTLIGGAVFWGKRFKITANGKFELEGNIGIGIKQRNIIKKNIPAGYTYIGYYAASKSPLPDHNVEQALPYFPAIFRFIYHL